MKKSFVYKVTLDRPRATPWMRYFTRPPTTSVVMEALAIEHLAELQMLRPTQTEQASNLRDWHDRMIKEIKDCGVPDAGLLVGVTSRKTEDIDFRTEITVEKMEAFS